MLRDKLLFGALAGVFATFVMEVPELILWKLKVLPHPLFHHAASIFLPVETLHHNYLGEVMGFVASKVYGAFLGVVFIYLLAYTGRRFFITKGLLYGAFLWLFSYCGFATLPIVKLSAHPRMPLDIFLIFLIHLLFGLAIGVFVRRFDCQLKDAP